jgi:hypothetical protein
METLHKIGLINSLIIFSMYEEIKKQEKPTNPGMKPHLAR